MLLKFLQKIVCLVGFAWQLSELGKLYFSFPFKTEIILSIMEELSPAPALSLCFRSIDVLDLKHLQDPKRDQRDYLASNFHTQDVDTLWQIQSNFTIAQIFKYSP